MTLNKLKRVLFFQKKNIQLLHIGDCEKKRNREMKKKNRQKDEKEIQKKDIRRKLNKNASKTL